MGVTQLSNRTGTRALRALGDDITEIVNSTLEQVTSAMVADAVRDVHKVTHNLASSIDNEKVADGHYQFKATAEYAGFEEKPGVTRDFPGHPFMEPAVLAHIDEVNSLFGKKSAEVAERNATD